MTWTYTNMTWHWNKKRNRDNRTVFSVNTSIGFIGTKTKFRVMNLLITRQSQRIERFIKLFRRKILRELVTSHLSCYECELCLNRNNQNCTNRKFIGDYKLMQMKVMNSETIERSETDTDKIHENISNLINIGSVVAVLADDPDYEFYLMKVNRKPFVLKKEDRDVWVVVLFQLGQK